MSEGPISLGHSEKKWTKTRRKTTRCLDPRSKAMKVLDGKRMAARIYSILWMTAQHHFERLRTCTTSRPLLYRPTHFVSVICRASESSADGCAARELCCNGTHLSPPVFLLRPEGVFFGRDVVSEPPS